MKLALHTIVPLQSRATIGLRTNPTGLFQSIKQTNQLSSSRASCQANQKLTESFFNTQIHKCYPIALFYMFQLHAEPHYTVQQIQHPSF